MNNYYIHAWINPFTLSHWILRTTPWGGYNEDIPFHCSEYSFLMMQKKAKSILQRLLSGSVIWTKEAGEPWENHPGLRKLDEPSPILSSLILPCPGSQHPPNSVSVFPGRCWQQPLHVCPSGCLLSVTAHAVLQYTRAECNWLGHCLSQLSQLIMVWFFPLFPITDLIRALFASYGSRSVGTIVSWEQALGTFLQEDVFMSP